MTFEESWPELSRKLERLLRARHVPDWQRDDIVQETGVRLFRAWDRIDPSLGVWGLARAIAIHAIADSANVRNRYELTEITDLPDPSDSERAGIARFHLSSVRRALPLMSSTDRRVLLAEVGVVSPPALGRSAMKMARSRARQRLRVLVEKPGSWAGLSHIPLRFRTACAKCFAHDRALVSSHLAEGAIAAFVALVLTVTAMDSAPPRDAPDGRIDGSADGPVDVAVALVGRDQPVRHRAGRASASSALGESTAAGQPGSPGSSGNQWDDDPLYARQTAEQIGKDAQREGEFWQDQAEFWQDQAEAEAEFWQDEAEFWQDQAEAEGEFWREQAQFLAHAAHEEARRAKRTAEELLP